MPKRRRQSKVGQATLFDGIEGLDKLVNKPKVLENMGKRVVYLLITQEDEQVPGYTDTALKIARQMQPEVQSNGKPPWLDANWQMRRRKSRMGDN